jgi:hypothetical protein
MHYFFEIFQHFMVKSSHPDAINKLFGENSTHFIDFFDFSKIYFYLVIMFHILKVLSLEPDDINLLSYEISTVKTSPSCSPIILKF